MSSSSSARTRNKRRRSMERYMRPIDSQKQPKSETPRRGRRRKWLLFVIILFAGIVWLLPMIVARTGMLNWIVAQATGDLNGTATLRSASLGWFSPVRASDLEIRDQQGAVVVELPEVSSGKSLFQLATNWKQLGTFTLERPTINVVLGPNGTNIEELIANYMTGPSGEPVGVELKVVDATVQVDDQVGGKKWTIEKFNLAMTVSDKPDGPMTLSASGVMPDAGSAGRFEAKVQTGANNQVRLVVQGLETAKLSSLLARFVPDMRLAGRLDAQVECQWDDKSAARVAADVQCTGFDLACAQLGNDRVCLATLKAGGKVAIGQDKIQIAKAAVESDVGGFILSGPLELTGNDPAAMLDSVLRQTFVLRGEVDLARAAAMLPGTLHVDPQTTITQGRLKVDVANQPDAQGMVCRGKVELNSLAALYRGQPLAWQQPFVAQVAARRMAAGVVVDQLDCRSSFFTLQAAGSRQNGSANAQFDLDQLARQLAGFVNLDGLQLAGNGSAKLAWQQTPQQQGAFLADGNLTIRNFQLIMPNRPPWQENSLVATLRATGATDFANATRIDTAEVKIEAGSEQFSVRLAEPLASLKADGPWPLAVDAQGNLAHCLARLKAWNMLADWNAAGMFRMTANLVASTSDVELHDSQCMINGLRLAGGGLNLDEQTTRLALAGQFDLAARRLAIRQASLQCNTLALNVNELNVSMPEAGSMELSGKVAYRGDVARLQSWITTPGTKPTWRAYGQLQGTGQLARSGETMGGQLDTTISGLVLQNADGQQFRDPQTRLTVRGDYISSSGQLKLDEILLATSAANVRAKGQIDSLGKDMKINLTGQIGYDWQKLMPLLQPYVGNQVVVAGQGARPFSLTGPLDAAQVQAAGAIDWSGVYAYGFRVGPGELDARLADGLLQIAPLNLAVSEGRFTAKPRLRLTPEPALLEVEPGQIIEQVRINPEMCAQGLQYIAPILAGVATAEGRFSIALDQCQIRFDDPAQSRLAGRLTVHTVEVGPGALLRELSVVLNRAASAKLQRESIIRFHLTDGRIYHEGLELVFPEMTIRTHGWVDLDQNMSLVAEMPIPPKWLAGQQVLNDALKNQILKVPIRGTLTKPQIDHRKLDEYNRSLLQRATKKAIEGELNRQFNRLFGK